MGSNLGDSLSTILLAIGALEKLSVTPLKSSRFYSTKPVDCPLGSPDFINVAVHLTVSSEETPESLLIKLQAIEKSLGRQLKTIHNEARSLDLDLILFGNEIRNSPQLTLPHPRAHLRAFVLTPLADLDPELRLIGMNETVRALKQKCSDVELVTIVSNSQADYPKNRIGG